MLREGIGVIGAASSAGSVIGYLAARQLARRRGVGQVAIDLGEARDLGYYTGITFAGHAPGAGASVARTFRRPCCASAICASPTTMKDTSTWSPAA